MLGNRGDAHGVRASDFKPSWRFSPVGGSGGAGGWRVPDVAVLAVLAVLAAAAAIVAVAAVVSAVVLRRLPQVMVLCGERVV